MEHPAHRLLPTTLYDPRFEHDGCGIGFVARISGEPSHEILTMALTAVGNLEHRGAVAADAKSGDGAGVLTQLPRKLLLRELAARGIRMDANDLALGMFFLPQPEDLREQCCSLVEATLREHGLPLLMWRDVPTDDAALGASALESKPFVRQAIIGRPAGASDESFERKLFLARKAIERAARERELDLYVPSFSSRSVVYKGLLTGSQVGVFYPDLRDPEYVTALAVYHQRYATNTFPQWHLAQPFRLLSHNGEINTREGNKNWMRARESTLRLPGHEDVDLTPVIAPDGSDSSDLDNTLELLVQGGRDVRHALMMLAPEAWEKVRDLDPAVRAFYQYHACLIEPWDGPAALTFSDGRVVGTALDRNGLRPARYLVTDDGLVVSGSEVGAVPIDEARIVHKGKLGPGQMIAVDTASGMLFTNDELKEWLAAQAPYAAWVKQHLKTLEIGDWRLGSREQAQDLQSPISNLQSMQQAFGYTSEELNVVLKPMLRDGQEPVGSMGDDTPMAVMSQWELGRPLFQFFKQRFAEVTNPPIDSLREELVMSHSIALGVRRNILEATPEHAHLIRLASPILTDAQLAALRRFDDPLVKVATVSSLVEIGELEIGDWRLGVGSDVSGASAEHQSPITNNQSLISNALDALCTQAEEEARNGVGVLIISDHGVDAEHVALPALLALGAVHHHLIRTGLRSRLSLVVESGEPREVHHFACLVGYGAEAVNPYLALASVRTIAAEREELANRSAESKVLSAEARPAKPQPKASAQHSTQHSALSTENPQHSALNTEEEEEEDPRTWTLIREAELHFIHAVEKGLLKVMSKMGIATLDSYCGAQIFESLGLNAEVLERCFTGTPGKVGGVGFDKIAHDVLARHARAFPDADRRPQTADGNQTANDDESGGQRSAVGGREQSELGGQRSAVSGQRSAVGGLLNPGFYKFKKDGEYHAFSPQVVHALHKAVQIEGADNGHWDEGYARYRAYADLVQGRPPTEPRDLLELVPAGAPVPLDEVEPIEAITRRFSTAAMSHGSTSAEAHETLSIAMNRLGGLSNSGEGGEAPARYRDERNSRIKQVASGRFGVTPAYLASADELQIKMAQGSKPGEGGQLPGHKVNAEIATIRHTVPGVSLISPPPHHDIYSIEDLAQLIYDLKQVNPNARVSVKLVAEAGVGTVAAGVAKGYADVIHISGHNGGTGASPLSSIKNAGVPWELGLAETQQTLALNNLRGRVRLRADGGFKTGRDVVVAALLGADEYSFGTAALVAEGCIMARACHANTCPVGIATQRADLRAKFPGKPEMVVAFFRYVAQEIRETLAALGLRSLEEAVGRTDLLRQCVSGYGTADTLDLAPVLGAAAFVGKRALRHGGERNPLPAEGENLNDRLLHDARGALSGRGPVELSYPIVNCDRTVGARLAGAIGQMYGDKGLPPETISIALRGSAGQSLGAFNAPGVHISLVGEANDYVGKGMAGGMIVARPDERARYAWHENTIIGNTVLYGATGGELYAAGRAGERFAVRNSGATAVVEGVGDHGCEYMTGGTVVVLGEAGRNFGAGMTGGIAYVLDEAGELERRYNGQLVQLDSLDAADEVRLLRLIRRHMELTGSPRAAEILARWDVYSAHFRRVLPRDAVARAESAAEGSAESAAPRSKKVAA